MSKSEIKNPAEKPAEVKKKPTRRKPAAKKPKTDE